MFEPSSRTGSSFKSAGLKIGSHVIYEPNAGEFSSVFKGETLEHTYLATYSN